MNGTGNATRSPAGRLLHRVPRGGGVGTGCLRPPVKAYTACSRTAAEQAYFERARLAALVGIGALAMALRALPEVRISSGPPPGGTMVSNGASADISRVKSKRRLQ